MLKRKTLFNQRGSFAHREFHGTESLIGCPSFFIFGTENWEEQLKKNPVFVNWLLLINTDSEQGVNTLAGLWRCR